MERKILIAQFTHPGDEHSISRQEKKDGVKKWNYGPHRRKFLKAVGQYVQTDGTLSTKQDMLFWGEWEPTSEFNEIDSLREPGVVPRYVHKPFLKSTNGTLDLPSLNIGDDKWRQNTDPFVFGDCFLYSCCKQRRKNMVDITQMGKLEKGSIILFGSTISSKRGGPYFVLDTVFVVGEYKEYHRKDAKTELDGFVPNDYFDIMGYEDSEDKSDNKLFVCYKGATVSNPVDGMFSFVPCRPCPDREMGFPRVKLTQNDFHFLSNNLNAAPKYTTVGNTKPYWDNLSEIVQIGGYKLGVNFEYRQRI